MITTLSDPIPLMKQLARMAGIPEGRIKRMVLVLDVDSIPTLYTEGYLTSEEELVETELRVEERPTYVDTTTMQNEVYRTKVPLKNQQHTEK